MPVRSSTPRLGSSRCLAVAFLSAEFREKSAVPKQLRAGIFLLAAFLIQPIRREGVMRTYLLVAILLLGCMVPLLAKADEPGPVLPNPSVNIQQPPLARPMSPPRPRVSRPDPPVKTAAIKKSSRPERRKSKRRAEKSKPRPVVEAKAKPSPRRTSPARAEKVVPKDATSSVEASPPEPKRPAADHPLRKPSVATTAKDTEAAPPRAPEPTPVIDLRKPDLDQPDRQDGAAPEQQVAGPASKPRSSNAAPQAAPGEQTAAVSQPATTEPQEARTLWWARQGSPAVARFRDCSAAYAARNIGKDAKATWADLLIRAAEGDCRVAFNDMADVLTSRPGNDAQPVIRSLIETTFLPAARKAAASTQRVAGGKSDPAPAAPAPPQ